MYSQNWHLWLKSHNVCRPYIQQDQTGLYWIKDKKKKQINWFEKHQPYHHKGMSKNNHKLIQAIHGRLEARPLVLDACAGLGCDAFLISLSGCDVISCEKNPQIFALLADMHAKANDKDWCGLERIKIIFGCALKIMRNWPGHRIRPDVVYLDPMFEKDFKGKVKANATLLKAIVDVEDATQLLESALSLARLKVVVKRPVYANQISDLKPTYIIQGKTTRFDVYQVS